MSGAAASSAAAAADAADTADEAGAAAANAVAEAASAPVVLETAAAVKPKLQATPVYVDSVAGNDNNAGTLAAPWKTLAKVSKTKLVAGQDIYLSCVGVWREAASLSNSTLPAGVTITGYGKCGPSKPRITGADDFSLGWARSGLIWSRSVPAGTPKIQRLFIGADAQRVAQWPNYGGLGAEYAKADPASVSSRTTLLVGAADRGALYGKTLTGAAIQVRSDPWVIESQTLSAYNAVSGQMTLAAATAYPMEGGDGYVLQDQLWMLDSPGEFYHDTVANKLYVYPSATGAQANLNNYSVEGSVRDAALTISGVSGVRLQGLSIGRSRKTGLLLNDSLGAVVQGSDASGNGDAGIRVVFHTVPPGGSTVATISDNTVSDNWRFGIDSTSAASVVISGNTVLDTGTLGYSGGSTAAIRSGNANSVLSNTISRTAYIGVYFSGVGGTKVSANLISNYCLRLTDCAAIYSWNGSTSPLVTSGMNSLVDQNRLQPVTANIEGAVGSGYDLVGGIYLDNFSSGVTLRSNVVASAPYGIIIHNSSNNTIDRNSVWLSTVASLKMSMDLSGNTDWLLGNVISSNTFVPALTASGTYPTLPALGRSLTVMFSDVLNGSGGLGSAANLFSANTIVALNDPTVTYALVSGPSGATYMDAAAWHRLNPSDGTVTMPNRFALYQLSMGSELMSNGGFDNGLTGWAAWFAGGSGSGSVSLGSGGGCDVYCASFTTSSVNDSLMGNSLSLTPNVPHMASFTATLAADATIATPYIGRVGPPGGSVVAQPGFSSTTVMSGLKGSTISYQGFFVPSSSDLARLNLKIATVHTPVAFDRVSIKPVLGYTLAKVSEYAATVHAPVAATLTVACADLGWPSGCTVKDVNGASITMPLALAAGTSAMLVRSNSPWAY